MAKKKTVVVRISTTFPPSWVQEALEGGLEHMVSDYQGSMDVDAERKLLDDLYAGAVEVDSSDPVPLKTWKVTPTKTGALLTINGRTFDLGPTAPPIAFELREAVKRTKSAENPGRVKSRLLR